MKRSFINTLVVAFVFGLFSMVGCIRKPPVDVPDSEKELDHLIILEVFYIGSLNERSVGAKLYYFYEDNDPYIKIYNPTKETKYLDGLGLAISDFRALEQVIFDKEEQNFTADSTAVYSVVHFPGSGKDYPILPGETKLITNVAADHTKPYMDLVWNEEMPGNPHSYDLSVADFEWLTPEDMLNGYAGGRTENPSVPNMIKTFVARWSQYEYFKLYGDRAVMLIDFPKEKFVGKEFDKLWKKYEVTYISSVGTTIPNVEEWACVIPSASVIDAVTLCPYERFIYHSVHPALDEGWTGVISWNESGANLASNPSYHHYLGKAVRRIHDGKKWVDTNNSLIDFEVVPASNNKDYRQPPASSSSPDE